MTPEQIIEPINKLQDRDPKIKGEGLWIKCPWHSNGNENSGSLKINIVNGSYPIGSWVCFGCSPRKHGNWNRLAVKLGLRKKSEDEDLPYAAPLNDQALAKLLDSEEKNELHEKLLKEPIIQASQKWRGINGWLLNELGARISMLNSSGTVIDSSRVYLPINVNNKWIGGIFCSWSNKSKIKYENEKHDSSKILFPYDYVAKKLKELPSSNRKLCIVEGPRDALNLLQNNILALANLGGETVWNIQKSELIQDLNVQALVLATDPDIIGNRLANIVKRQLSSTIPKIVRFKMEVTYSPTGKVLIKEDPGSLSYDRVKYLKQQMDNL